MEELVGLSDFASSPGMQQRRHLDDQPSAVVKHFLLDQPFGCEKPQE
jgi:hypothetical protein